MKDQHDVEKCSVYRGASISGNFNWSGNTSALLDPASEESYGSQWVEETGTYVTIGAANMYFDAKYSHPSDGMLDMILLRKGTIRESLSLAFNFLHGAPEKSKLMQYSKVKAMVIEQIGTKVEAINFDGEVLHGPGPFRFEIVPKLFNVLSEK